MENNLYDVIIVGAGISGIGNAYWLQKKCPNKKIAILEARDTIGGTWSLFKYPGIRSDSDMFTFGYRFKPWNNPQSLSSGENILSYLKETVEQNDLNKFILYNHKMNSANWLDESKHWELNIDNNGNNISLKTKFLSICTGYYDYKEAHRPKFKGEENFKGALVIPQFWPQDLDYKNKEIAVIGSGATAVTLMPSLVNSGAKHVTMVQRSPSYVMNLPNKNKMFVRWKKVLPMRWAYRATRIKNILLQMILFTISKMFPGFAKKVLIKGVTKQLPENYPVDKHFTPKYAPWDQRLCVVPDGDLFKAINDGSADVLTGNISEFTEDGLVMVEGEKVHADIIIIATGLKIQLLGGSTLSRNGEPIQVSNSKVYKGMLLSNIPNFIYSFGYTNAPWTLKVDLTANYLCKLIQYMDKYNYKVVTAVPEDNSTSAQFLNLSSGYIQRASNVLPKSGTKRPWKVYQNYLMDMLNIRFGRIANKALKFEK